MTIYLPELSDDELVFPHPANALEDPNGLLAFGGSLSLERLTLAYRNGIFPWFSEDEPVLWWSPDPRCVIYPRDFKPSKSLIKRLRRWRPRITFNWAFKQVVENCARVKRKQSGTWILPDMAQAYGELHARGIAHSIEVWDEDKLVGGLYGVRSGAVFSGESMFHKATDASKIAFWALNHTMLQSGGQLIDCQITNPHLVSLGAVEVPRDAYLRELLRLRDNVPASNAWQPAEVNAGDLLSDI